jgi:hypothetical protein
MATTAWFGPTTFYKNVSRDDTFDLIGQLAKLMPAPFTSRDAAAVEIIGLQDLIVSKVAGIKSELLFIGSALPHTDHYIEEARALASLIVRPRAVDTYIRYAQAEARAILTEHHDAVVALAEELFTRRTLDRAEIDGVIAAVPPR